MTGPHRQSGNQFTFFTSTKVQILTQTSRLYAGARAVEIEWTVGPLPIDDGAQFACFTSTEVQMLLRLLALLVQKHNC